MKKISILLTTLFICEIAIAQSTATAYADGQPTDALVVDASEYTFEFPIETADAANTFNSPLVRELTYTLYVGDGEEAFGLDNLYNSGGQYKEAKSWKKFAKADGVIKESIDGKYLDNAFRVLKDKDWPAQDFKVKVWIEVLADIKGNTTVLSEVWLTIPQSLRNQYYSAKNNEVYEMFTSGTAANTIGDTKLQKAIKKYMETKWPGENITTVTARYFAYEDYSKTKFKFEGYYITQKNGTCKYNSCYGNGTDHGDRYSLSFFNSMNAEKTMSCENAAKLKNM